MGRLRRLHPVSCRVVSCRPQMGRQTITLITQSSVTLLIRRVVSRRSQMERQKITLVTLLSHLSTSHQTCFTSQMGRQKITLAKAFLDFQLNLLLVDVDVVILRNVMHYFAK